MPRPAALLLSFFFTISTFAGAIRLPSGSNANTLAANDDQSTGAVNIGFALNFFGVNTSTVFVNNNGNITFNSALSDYTPNGLAIGVGQPIIAAFFADVDTRGAGSGLVTYGGTGTISDAALGWVNRPFFAVEWPAVGYYNSQTNKLNSFELILVNRSDIAPGDFDIEFNYDVILWETGGASGGSNGLGGTSAAVGYSNSAGTYFQLPGSLVNGALINGGPNALISHSLNSSVPGRYDFQVRGGTVVSGVPEPGSLVLLTSGLVGLAWFRSRKSARRK